MSELPIWKNSRRVAPRSGVFSRLDCFFDMIFKSIENLAEEFIDERSIAFAAVRYRSAVRDATTRFIRFDGSVQSMGRGAIVPTRLFKSQWSAKRDHRVEQVVRWQILECGADAQSRADEPILKQKRRCILSSKPGAQRSEARVLFQACRNVSGGTTP